MLCRVTIWLTLALAVWGQEISEKEFKEKCDNVPASCCNDTLADDNKNIIYQEKVDKAIRECPPMKEKSFTQHANHKHVEFLQHCRMECCKIVEHEFDRALWDATVRECSHLQDVPPKCDQHQCISSKLGFTREDGSFIKANVTKTIELIFDGTPEVILAIKSNCIEGDLDAPNWHESGTCELTKFWHCVDVQKLRFCPTWSNEGDCAGAKEQAATCFS